MDWHDLKLVATVIAGLVLAALLSTARNWWDRLIAVAAGLFFAVVGTDPLVHWLGLEPDVYQYAAAGFLAMSGDRLARRLFRVIEAGQFPRLKR